MSEEQLEALVDQYAQIRRAIISRYTFNDEYGLHMATLTIMLAKHKEDIEDSLVEIRSELERITSAILNSG